MEDFLELAKEHESKDDDLTLYIVELGFTSEETFNDPKTPYWKEHYDDMKDLLIEEIEQEELDNSKSKNFKFDSAAEHGLCFNEL